MHCYGNEIKSVRVQLPGYKTKTPSHWAATKALQAEYGPLWKSLKAARRPEENIGAKMQAGKESKHYFSTERKLLYLPSQNIWLQTAKTRIEYDWNIKNSSRKWPKISFYWKMFYLLREKKTQSNKQWRKMYMWIKIWL